MTLDTRDSKRPARVDRWLEIAFAILSVHVLLLAVFRRYGLAFLGIPLSFTSPIPALAGLVAIAALRVRSNRRSGAPPAERFARLRPGNWLDGMSRPGLVLACFLALVFWIFHDYGGRLGGDGVMNYIYVRSLLIDGDFDLTNEFEEFVPAKFQHIAETARAQGLTPDPTNEPGPAILWAPAFLLTHGLVKASRWLGSEIPANGYSFPYVNAVAVASLLLGFFAVAMSYRIARRYFDPTLAAVSVSLLWLASTLYWYTVHEPTMPHAAGAAVVSLFLHLWLRLRDRSTAAGWVLLALTGGLVLAMQRYLVFVFLAPLATAVARLANPETLRSASRRSLVAAAAAAAAFLLAASPMFFYNLSHSQELIRIGDLSGFTLRYWSSPRIGEVLFSSNHGLFSWTPAAIVAVVGLFLFLRKDWRVGTLLLLTLSFGLYLLGSTWDWYAGTAFGSRRTTEAFPILALGFCAACELALRRPRIFVLAAALGLVSWNFMMAGLVKRNEVPGMGTFSFSDAASKGAARFYERFGHPWSVPANWIFARKYGVSPGQFDPIFGHREYHNLSVDVGAPEDRYFVGGGWSKPESDSGGRTFRWSSGPESTFLVSLFEPYDYRLAVDAEPSRHPEGSRQVVLLEVNGRSAGRLGLEEGWQKTETVVPASHWAAGLNEIRFTYLWTVEAGRAYGSDDSRQIAIRLDRLDLQIVK